MAVKKDYRRTMGRWEKWRVCRKVGGPADGSVVTDRCISNDNGVLCAENRPESIAGGQQPAACFSAQGRNWAAYQSAIGRNNHARNRRRPPRDMGRTHLSWFWSEMQARSRIERCHSTADLITPIICLETGNSTPDGEQWAQLDLWRKTGQVHLFVIKRVARHSQSRAVL